MEPSLSLIYKANGLMINTRRYKHSRTPLFHLMEGIKEALIISNNIIISLLSEEKGDKAITSKVVTIITPTTIEVTITEEVATVTIRTTLITQVLSQP